MKGKNVVLTGATSGLGLASAEYLANRGADLTLIARNADKANNVKEELELKTGNKNIAVEIADLSLISDVNQVAAQLIKKGKPIDVLINNAGALFNKRLLTEEGLEQSFALLLLSPFTLTEQLMPLIKASKRGRVINVLSGGMYAEKIKSDDLEYSKGQYDGSRAYARAKRGLMICTENWAAKHQDVVFNAMHPGWADTPGVVSALPMFYKLTKGVLRTPAQGADTINWLACAKEAGKVSGQFWLDRRPHSTHMIKKTRASREERQQFMEQLMHYMESTLDKQPV